MESPIGRYERVTNPLSLLRLRHFGLGLGRPILIAIVLLPITTPLVAPIFPKGQEPHAITGEWGHNPLPWWRADDAAPACYCGKQACIETYLSGPGLARNYQLRFGHPRSSTEIVAAAASGDESCQQMLDCYYDQMARSLAHLINIVDPDAIVLGGGMSNIEAIYPAVAARLGEYVFSDYVATPILKAARGDSSGVYGAALLWD